MEQLRQFNQKIHTPFWPIYSGSGKFFINRGLVYNTANFKNYIIPRLGNSELKDFYEDSNFEMLSALSSNGVIYVDVDIDSNLENHYFEITDAEIKAAEKLPESFIFNPKILICEFFIEKDNATFSKIRRSDIPIWVQWIEDFGDYLDKNNSGPFKNSEIKADVKLMDHTFHLNTLTDIQLKYTCKPNGSTYLKGGLEISCISSKASLKMTAFGVENEDGSKSQTSQSVSNFTTSAGIVEKSLVSFN